MNRGSSGHPTANTVIVKYERASLELEIDPSEEGGGLAGVYQQVADLLEVPVDTLKIVHRAHMLPREGRSGGIFQGDTLLALGPQHGKGDSAVHQDIPGPQKLAQFATTSPAAVLAAGEDPSKVHGEGTVGEILSMEGNLLPQLPCMVACAAVYLMCEAVAVSLALHEQSSLTAAFVVLLAAGAGAAVGGHLCRDWGRRHVGVGGLVVASLALLMMLNAKVSMGGRRWLGVSALGGATCGAGAAGAATALIERMPPRLQLGACCGLGMGLLGVDAVLGGACGPRGTRTLDTAVGLGGVVVAGLVAWLGACSESPRCPPGPKSNLNPNPNPNPDPNPRWLLVQGRPGPATEALGMGVNVGSHLQLSVLGRRPLVLGDEQDVTDDDPATTSMPAAPRLPSPYSPAPLLLGSALVVQCAGGGGLHELGCSSVTWAALAVLAAPVGAALAGWQRWGAAAQGLLSLAVLGGAASPPVEAYARVAALGVGSAQLGLGLAMAAQGTVTPTRGRRLGLGLAVLKMCTMIGMASRTMGLPSLALSIAGLLLGGVRGARLRAPPSRLQT